MELEVSPKRELIENKVVHSKLNFEKEDLVELLSKITISTTLVTSNENAICLEIKSPPEKELLINEIKKLNKGDDCEIFLDGNIIYPVPQAPHK